MPDASPETTDDIPEKTEEDDGHRTPDDRPERKKDRRQPALRNLGEEGTPDADEVLRTPCLPPYLSTLPSKSVMI